MGMETKNDDNIWKYGYDNTSTISSTSTGRHLNNVESGTSTSSTLFLISKKNVLGKHRKN